MNLVQIMCRQGFAKFKLFSKHLDIADEPVNSVRICHAGRNQVRLV